MRLLKTHSHTSERLGYETRKNAKKVIEGNANTIIRQTTVKTLPRTASVAGGARRRRRYDKVKNLPQPTPFVRWLRWRHRVSPCRSLPIKLVLGATRFLEPLKKQRSSFNIPTVVMASDKCRFSPVPSQDCAEYETLSKHYENGPSTYFWGNYRPPKAVP